MVRIRGLVEITLTTADAIGAGFHGALGIAIISNEAFAAGVTAVPSPTDDLDFPWFWHSFFSVRTVTATIADGANAQGLVTRIEIDNKSMRKQTSGETMVGVIDQIESTNAVFEMHATTRVLDKLA